MPYCVNCGKKIDKNDDFCQECGAKARHKEKESKKDVEMKEPKENNVKIVEKVIQKEVPVVKEVHHHGGGGVATLIIILIIIGIILFALVNSGALDELFSGGGVQIIDPCERQFKQCNHDCGEGWGSDVCKTACTIQYHSCKAEK